MIRVARYPTEKRLRALLIVRVNHFMALTGCSRSEIGTEALNDKAAVGRIEKGSNFQIATYQRLMSWLDNNWPRRRDGRFRDLSPSKRRKSDRRQSAVKEAVSL